MAGQPGDTVRGGAAERAAQTTEKMHYANTRPMSAPPLEHLIADYLRAFWPELPAKHIRMNTSGPKYSWAKDDDDNHTPLAYADLRAHAAGATTIGAHLHDSAGRCRIGMLDIDQGGRAAILAALAAAHKLGYTAYGLYYPAGARPGAEHDGGRLVVAFAHYAPYRDVRAALDQIRDAAGLPNDTEIWPGGGNAVALPFAYHVRKQTRGELLTHAAEPLDLTTDLAAGFALVLNLPLNGAPPAVSPIGDTPKTVTPVTVPRVSLGERAAGRASLDDVKARFNAAHPPAALLADYGAVQHSAKDFSCPFCDHSHPTTLFIYNERIYSRSPNCKIPQKRGLDPFGLYVRIEHNDNVTAALQDLNPIPPAPAPELLDTRDDAERWASQHATAVGTDYVLAPEELERRSLDAQRQQAARKARSQARMAQIAFRAAQLHTSTARAFVRAVWAYHQQRWEERAAPEHVDSNERIARSVLGLDRTPTKSELRRLQLAHARLIGRGYLVRTIRYRKGEHNTNCWQPGDGYMMIVAPDETITMVDHESDSCVDFVACEEGGNAEATETTPSGCASALDTGAGSSAAGPDNRTSAGGRAASAGAGLSAAPVASDSGDHDASRAEGPPAGESPTREARIADPAALLELLSFASYLRNLAAELSGQALDLAELAARPLADLEQLEAQLLADGAFVPIGNNSCAINAAGGACYDPAADWTAGGVLDLSQWRDPLELRQKAAGVDQAEPPQLLDLAPVAKQGAARHVRLLAKEKRRRQPRGELDAVDRYRLDLAGMEETQLAGELKKHQRTIAKFEGQHWLDRPDGPRDRLGLVEQEIDARDRYDQVRRRRSPFAAVTAPKAAGQLQLTLEAPSAGGFALSPAEPSPPLTSSLGP